MNINKSLIILLAFAFSIALFIFIPKQLKQTGNNTTAASSTPVKRAIDCSAEISNLYQKNDKSLVKYQDQNSELVFGGQRYNTAVFNCPDEKQSYQKVFLLSQTDREGKDKILFVMEDERFDKAEIKDINKDKVGEFIVTHGNSGNCWNCQGQSVFQIDKVNGAVKNLFPDMPIPEGGEYSNVWLNDVNGDGIEDVMVTDDSWELHDGFFHSNSPSHIELITWKDGKYQNGGEMFSKYYLKQISQRNVEMQKLLKEKTTGLNDIVSLAIENYWDYQEINQEDLGWDIFQKQTNLNNLLKTIKVSEEDKKWLEGIKQELENEKVDPSPTQYYFP